jgi:hypothetical protein
VTFGSFKFNLSLSQRLSISIAVACVFAHPLLGDSWFSLCVSVYRIIVIRSEA